MVLCLVVSHGQAAHSKRAAATGAFALPGPWRFPLSRRCPATHHSGWMRSSTQTTGGFRRTWQKAARMSAARPMRGPGSLGVPRLGRAGHCASDTAGPSPSLGRPRLVRHAKDNICILQTRGQEKINLFRCTPLSGTENPGHCPFVLLCWETQSNSAEPRP